MTGLTGKTTGRIGTTTGRTGTTTGRTGTNTGRTGTTGRMNCLATLECAFSSLLSTFSVPSANLATKNIEKITKNICKNLIFVLFCKLKSYLIYKFMFFDICYF